MQTFDDMPRRLYFGVSVLLEVNRLVRLLIIIIIIIIIIIYNNNNI